MPTQPLRLIIGACGGLVLSATVAFAGQAPQTPATPPPPPKLEGTGELSFVMTSGNTSTDTLGLGGGLIYRTAPWTIDSKVAFVRTEADSVENARSFAAS